ncbi:metal ABC transporter substrate-binding protein [Enterococcus saccharolyticus]|uniref:Periplasmic solute binding protein n=1 Tax=Enterococcus saccharolyticus subsp. saccharolyticus ATCC 43076 TaxID=1139996 RepID=S0NNC5_9ENTE|nr:metal ABC transporter substrate-binding protein [Enterococcus saccharolyticus]EOT25883.1 periplasmic solute binding protein [Enterococcus saccharolyticus subsp. saccharolyticus ATCC 43076]EOT82749.1 periplasmic solute binding protein [Enterococcus saccharolyticus subsp. saccharolyticus ATCC 43076]OJG91112.1 periplasmic solute binding protein [Enterococcus saccharolyticus]
MKKILLTSALLIGSVLLGACGQSKETNDELKIMTTFYPMYEFSKQVVGDEGDVELLIPAGTEAHDYEPSAKDIAKISEADALVYNSAELETWVDRLGESIDTKQTTFIEAAGQIDLMAGAEDHDHEHDEQEEEHHHAHDPHVWVDPVLAMKEVETIRDVLSEKYPEKKANFEKNAAAYLEELQTLDQEFQAAFKDAKNKTFVTQHAAFAYLAKQYGLIQESIAGISPDEEPSPSRLAELKHYVEDHHVKVIYFEENASSKVAETLAQETGVSLEVLNPLESLTNEQLKAGENYVSVMRDNLDALKASIQ